MNSILNRSNSIVHNKPPSFLFVQFPFNYHIISELIKPLPVQQHQLTTQFSTGIVNFSEVSCSLSVYSGATRPLAGDEALETPLTESKSVLLPLQQSPIYFILQAITVRPEVDTPCFQSFGVGNRI